MVKTKIINRQTKSLVISVFLFSIFASVTAGEIEVGYNFPERTEVVCAVNNGSFDFDIAGDSGTGTIDESETFSLLGAGTVTTSMAGNTLTITGSAGSSSLLNTSLVKFDNTTWIRSLFSGSTNISYNSATGSFHYNGSVGGSDGFVGENATIIRVGNTSWITLNQNVNTSAEMNLALINNTIVRAGNVSWVYGLTDLIHDQDLNTTSAVQFDNITVVTNSLFMDTMILNHTSTHADDHAFEIDIHAAGFADVKAIDINYETGALAADGNDELILMNIDQFLTAGGDITGLEVVTTEGSADVIGMELGALVHPIIQLSGDFTGPTAATRDNVNVLSNFTSTTSDMEIFKSDNENITIKHSAKFEEIEFILNTTASGSGISPVFRYSTGGSGYATFNPSDATEGMKFTGVILWEDSDIPAWATNADGNYHIRITRTRNSLTTIPIENKVQIAVTTEYHWNRTGDLLVNEVHGTAFYDDGVLLTSGGADGFVGQNETIIRVTNTSWITDNQNDLNTHNSSIEMNIALINDTIVRATNTTWITDNQNPDTNTHNSSAEMNSSLDNPTIIRVTNTTWITDNQVDTNTHNSSAEMNLALINNTIIRVTNTSWLTVNCETITGSADLCDGSDDGGAGSAKLNDSGWYNTSTQTITNLNVEINANTRFKNNGSATNVAFGWEDIADTGWYRNGDIDYGLAIVNEPFITAVNAVKDSLNFHKPSNFTDTVHFKDVTGCSELETNGAGLLFCGVDDGGAVPINETLVKFTNTSWITGNQLFNTSAEMNDSLDNEDIIRVDNTTWLTLNCATITGDASLCDGSDADTNTHNSSLDMNTSLVNWNIIRVTNTSWLTLNCETITGSADLCDGNDAGGVDTHNSSADMNTALINDTIIRAINTTWITTNQDPDTNTHNSSLEMNTSLVNWNIIRVTNTSWLTLNCETITGSADLCDGNDAGGVDTHNSSAEMNDSLDNEDIIRVNNATWLTLNCATITGDASLCDGGDADTNTFNSSLDMNTALVNTTILRTANITNALCIQLTGSADLCDGSDATGAGGAKLNDSGWSNSSIISTNTNLNIIGTLNLTIDTDTLWVDSNNERIGIGIAKPLADLHVSASTGEGLQTPDGNNVATFASNIASGTFAAISIIGGSAGKSIVDFGDSSDNDVGAIEYNHGDNSMMFRTAATADQVIIDNGGKVGIGLAPTSRFHTAGTYNISSATGRQCYSNTTCILICESSTTKFSVCD